jgi:cytochrome c oxidase accessory protein FixG
MMPSSMAPSLYAAHQKVYAREVRGRFANLRVIAALALLTLFYGVSWVRWDGRQAVLFDLPGRKFHVFGLTFFPQDFILLTWLLVIAALSLFFFTALAGRLWCGYACPQTVWTEIYVWMERFTEGGRAQQMRLDQGRWHPLKIARKGAKHALWLGLSVVTGFAFVGYFSPIQDLWRDVVTLHFGAWEWFWIVFYSFATYANAGFLREQVCKYMCPYARFQSVMFDRHTLIIAYDEGRGEPRGTRRHGEAAPGKGDCVDCTLCVQVCPTGIDIRRGLQYECIACAACIDACDNVMDKLARPRGLIRYATQTGSHGRPRYLRPRILAYATALGMLVAGFCCAVALRVPFNLDVLHDRNALSRELDDGRVENVYSVRLINKDASAHDMRLSARGLPGIEVDSDVPFQSVPAESVKNVVIRVRANASGPTGGHDIYIAVRAVDDPTLKAETRARFFNRR